MKATVVKTAKPDKTDRGGAYTVETSGGRRQRVYWDQVNVDHVPDGTRVLIHYTDGAMLAKITKKNDDGTYTALLDNGTKDTALPLDELEVVA